MKSTNITLFHGSGVTVISPKIIKGDYTKDFGYGFYCTKNYTQAERWAIHQGVITPGGVPTVNLYLYNHNPELKCKRFTKMTNEWLDFIAECRKSKDHTPHNYDIVEGPMADDKIWNYVEDYLSGAITRRAFWELAKFSHPTHQISFHTQAALNCLSFEKAVHIDG